MQQWRARLVSIAWGAAGVIVMLLALHAYFDHLAFHQLLNMVQQSPVAPPK